MSFKKIVSSISAALPFVALPSKVGAIPLEPIGTDTVSISNVDTSWEPLATYTPSEMMKTVINLMLGAAGVASFIILLWGGLQWILAGGDKEGTEKARKKITAALIGLAIVFSAYALLYILRVLFNVNLIEVNLTTIGT